MTVWDPLLYTMYAGPRNDEMITVTQLTDSNYVHHIVEKAMKDILAIKGEKDTTTGQLIFATLLFIS